MIVGVLLAAGSGSRYGKHKLLETLPNRVPMAVQAARNLRSALPNSIAVVRENDPELSRLLEAEGLRVVTNPDAASGMGGSLACGVRATAEASAWVVTLADMPFIEPRTIVQVAGLLVHEDSIVAPVYRGKRGHPVGFGGWYGERLMELRGDVGARGVVREFGERVRLLEVGDEGVVRDVDLVGDLRG